MLQAYHFDMSVYRCLFPFTSKRDKAAAKLLFASQPTKLAELNASPDANHNNNRCYDHRPKLHLQHILVETRLGRRADRGQHEQQDGISTHPVVLVHCLRVALTPVQTGQEVLSEAHCRLYDDQDVCNQA